MVLPSVYGVTVPTTKVEVLDASQMPIVSSTELSLDIEFEVENTGFEKVLILLPPDFEVDSDNIDSARGQAIITLSENRLGFNKKYGKPDDRFAFRNTHFVMTSESPVSKGASMNYSELGETRRGWYIRPNERVIAHIKVTSTGTGIIDPFSLEGDLPFIEVTKFYATIRFEPVANSYGFILAPYVVRNATLISSYPNIFADGNDFDETEYYWHTFKLPETEETRIIDVVDWDDWFTTSSLPLTPTLLSATDLEYYPIEKVEKSSEAEEIFWPVWYVEGGASFVRYEYQWRKNLPISGLYLENLQEPPRVTASIPEWNGWF